MKIPILRVRDKDGNYVDIPAIRGQGDMEKSAYDSDGSVAAAGGIAAYVQQNGGGGTGGGANGEDGVTFYPHVDADGNLSWTNDGGLDNPSTVNIRGPEGPQGQPGQPGQKGDKGDPGQNGPAGEDGKTPVKGTDYWTDSDKQEIIEELKDEGIGGATVLTATIGTNWTDNDDGTKSQTVSLSGVTAQNNAQVDTYYNDGEYADYVEAQNQFLEFITNGFAKTVAGGIKFTIFGDANTVSIPIVVEVV